MTRKKIKSNVQIIKGNQSIDFNPFDNDVLSLRKKSLIDSKILIQKKEYFPKVISDFSNDTVFVYLTKIKDEMILDNIYFDNDSFNLTSGSKEILDIIYQWIETNQILEIEIGGHTDKIGTDSYNQKLSERRALSVYNYLINKNNNLSNLSFKGYGSSVPIRKGYEGPKNRRIEFKILSVPQN